MDRRARLIAIAEDTLKILETGNYVNSKGVQVDISKPLWSAVQSSILYKPSMETEIDNALKQILTCIKPTATVIEVTLETSLEATKRLAEEGHQNIMCLNFASARTPGGGFLKGSVAQEESLARSSGLYPCISQMAEMYEYNRKTTTGFYSDYMIFSPQVPVFKDDEGKLLDQPYYVSFITAPAVNAGIVKEKAPEKSHMILPVMKRRIEKILSIALIQRQEVLVLGAFGCGVFKNNPDDIAELFREILLDDSRFRSVFKRIVFAVYDPSPNQENFRPFHKAFVLNERG